MVDRSAARECQTASSQPLPLRYLPKQSGDRKTSVRQPRLSIAGYGQHEARLGSVLSKCRFRTLRQSFFAYLPSARIYIKSDRRGTTYIKSSAPIPFILFGPTSLSSPTHPYPFHIT